MKAIILAAGLCTRIRTLTQDKPKCLLELKGKTILQHQIDTFHSCNITDISIVKGFKAEMINIPGIKYYINSNYKNNNILNSLLYAEDELNDDVVVSYSDILFEKIILERLISSKRNISICADVKWIENYHGRSQHPVEEAEKVVFDRENRVIEIGKILRQKHDVYGEFIGLMKFTKEGCVVFKQKFYRAKTLFWGSPFQKANTFEEAYLTDMIQHMVDLGVEVYCVIIEGGWIEIDTIQDLEMAERKNLEWTIV